MDVRTLKFGFRAAAAGVLALVVVGCSEDEKKSTEPAVEAGAPSLVADCGPCDAPSFCHAGECTEPGGDVVGGGVGSEPGEFMAADVESAASEGPQSLAVSPSTGQVYVLDQLNERVSVYVDGDVENTIPIQGTTSEELAVLESGLVVVMDRYDDELKVYDSAGAVLEISPVSGAGVESPAHVRWLYTRTDGVWMKAGKLFVHALDNEGKPVERRRILPGLPSPELEFLMTLKMFSDGSLNVVTRSTLGASQYQQKQLRFERRISRVLGYDIDDQGRVYIATEHVWAEDPEDEESPYDAEPLLTVLDSDLEIIRQEELPPQPSSRFTTRTFSVTPNGAVYRLFVEDERISVVRY